MISFESGYTIVQDISKNTDATQLTKFKRDINIGYHLALSKIGRWFLNETDSTTLDTVDGTQYYDLPSHYLRMQSVTVTVSDQDYVLQEVRSQSDWNELNALQTTESDIATHFFIRANAGRFQLGLFPIPSTDDYDITMVFERREKDLSADDYDTGTVTVTNGDATVTGAGTTFTVLMQGRMFKSADQEWYRIATFTDATHFELATPYEGTTATTQTYTIADVGLLPEGYQMIPYNYALMMWFSQQKDPQQIALYKNLFDEGIRDLQSAWGARTGSSVIRSRSRRKYVHPHRPLTITA